VHSLTAAWLCDWLLGRLLDCAGIWHLRSLGQDDDL
jgi:hypothetical protein